MLNPQSILQSSISLIAINVNRSIRAQESYDNVVVVIYMRHRIHTTFSGTTQNKRQNPPKNVSSLTRLSYPRSGSSASDIIISIFPGQEEEAWRTKKSERNEMERIWGNNNYHATMLTTRTRWWPVVNETTEWKINKIKGKKIGCPSNEGNDTLMTRMDVRFVTSLNKNNSPLVIPVSIVTQYARFKS